MPDRFLTVAVLLFFLGGCLARSGIYHPVHKGQTLYSISRAYGVNARALAKANDLTNPDRLIAGQRLFIPGAARVREVPATVPTAKKPPPANSPATDRRSATGGSKPTKTPDQPTSNIKFTWPVQGKIVRSFGRNAGQACSGLEIAVPLGTPVAAAATGRVIYSGSGIKGYGHLVIIRHADDFFTVYGFNRNSLVANGKEVQKGQRIAYSGVPPAGGTPRLHFEIRRGKSPVNPIFYLP